MDVEHSLDRIQQLLLQALVVLIRREIQPIKARMAPRQTVRIAALLDREPPRRVRALQILEPVDRYTGCASGELQQARLAFGRPASNALPEPLDDFVVHLVTTIVGVLGPVVAERVKDE